MIQYLLNLKKNDELKKSIFDDIKKNGIQIGSRWKISEEDDSGKLFLRDMLGTADGVDARYTFRNGTTINF